MSLVPNNSIVSYVAQFVPGVGYNSGDVQGKVTAALAAVGMPVLTMTVSGESFFSIGTEPLTVTLQAKIQTGYDYGDETDVASIMNHAIYSVFGVLPSGSIPRFQPPSGAGVVTGQPNLTAPKPPDGCIAGSSNDLAGSFSLSCWFSNLTSKGLSTVGLLTIAIAVGVAIFFFAPRPRVSVG